MRWRNDRKLRMRSEKDKLGPAFGRIGEVPWCKLSGA